MSFWLTDPELFLYAKGTGPDDVHLWRCKKPASSSSSSLVVPMKSDDFDYVSNVKNHMELIVDIFDWDETDYKRLVKYIFERRLLVNSDGFVIAELHKVGKDGNEEVLPPIYIRSLDVLNLKPYIPNLRERPIPSRTVRYLEDVDGKAAPVMEEEDSKLAKRVADLELKNKSLEGKVTKLTADLATRTNELATSQLELNRALKNAKKEVWMNDFVKSEWVDIEGVRKLNPIDENLIFIGQQGTFTTEDGDTNVLAKYMYKVKRFPSGYDYKAISIEDLTPNKEKARFSELWCYCRSQGKIYVIL